MMHIVYNDYYMRIYSIVNRFTMRENVWLFNLKKVKDICKRIEIIKCICLLMNFGYSRELFTFLTEKVSDL